MNNRLYEAEVKERWGDTAAYREYEQKGAVSEDTAAGLMAVFADFAACRAAGEASDSPAAQAVVRKLQDYITAHFYTCTDSILAGLGQMYVADDRFCRNIDRHGEGTVAFVSAAIAAHGKK